MNIFTLDHNDKNSTEWFLGSHAVFIKSIIVINAAWKTFEARKNTENNVQPKVINKYDQVESLLKVSRGLRKSETLDEIVRAKDKK